MWITAMVQIALVQAIQFLVKESDIIQAGCFLLPLAGLDSQVVVTNVISITPNNKGGKNKGEKLKYLMQFTPQELAEDLPKCDLMTAYPAQAMALMDSRLQKYIKSDQLKLHSNAPPCLKVLKFATPLMNVRSNKIGGFLIPLVPKIIGGHHDPVAN